MAEQGHEIADDLKAGKAHEEEEEVLDPADVDVVLEKLVSLDGEFPMAVGAFVGGGIVTLLASPANAISEILHGEYDNTDSRDLLSFDGTFFLKKEKERRIAIWRKRY